MTTPLYICLNGNIASGKTTLAKKFKDEPGYLVFEENFEEEPSLIEYYRSKDHDTARYYWYRFQHKILDQWFENIEKIIQQKPQVVVFDRALISSLPFIILAQEVGLITEEEQWILTHSVMCTMRMVIDRLKGNWLFLNLVDEPERCLNRALERNKFKGLEVVEKSMEGYTKNPNTFTYKYFDRLEELIKIVDIALHVKWTKEVNMVSGYIKGNEDELYKECKRLIPKYSTAFDE